METRNGRRRVLDQYELNLGQSAKIARPAVAEVAMGDPVRLLDLRGDSEVAEVFTVCMGATLNDPEAFAVDATHQITGPLTGIVEFGNGSGQARVEFDIPPPSRFPFNPVAAGVPGVYRRYSLAWRSGVSLAVPASAIRVMARNDNNMPVLTSPATIYGVSNVGDIDPVVFAFASRFGTYGSTSRNLRKSVLVGSLQVNESTADYCPIGIPAFAKQCVLHRTDPALTALQLSFYTAGGILLSTYNFATNQWGPVDVPAWADYCYLTNTGPAQATLIRLVFDLSI
jgi:hypothetical protein